MTIKLDNTYFDNCILIDDTLYTQSEFIEEFNVSELLRNPDNFIELEEPFIKTLEQKYFEKHNEDEIQTLNKIFNYCFNYPDENIWDEIKDAVDDNLLSYEIVEDYIKIYPDKREYLSKVLGDLKYNFEIQKV